MPLSGNQMKITVGARASPLSQSQVQELLREIRQFHPQIDFDVHFVSTVGDRDRTTSLRTLDRTDFFTREIDQLILSGECRIGVHSAKDLPDPLPSGLALICLTKGVDSSDSLVMRPGMTIDNLPSTARVATSSVRREEAARYLRTDFIFKDLRGTIEERLELLNRGEADAVIVAEAALIRLGLTHLNRVRLPGETAQGQGKLAVVSKESDEEMRTLFLPLASSSFFS